MKNTTKPPHSKKMILQAFILGISMLSSQQLFAALLPEKKMKFNETTHILPELDTGTLHYQHDTIHIPVLNSILDSLDVSSKFREKVYDPRHTQRFHEIFYDISLHDIDLLQSNETLEYIIKSYSKHNGKENNKVISESDIFVIKTRLQELRKLMMKEKIADLTNQYLIYSSAEYAQRTGEFYIFDPNTTDLLETLLEQNKAQEYQATIGYLKSNEKYSQIHLSNLSETSFNLLGLFLHHYFSFDLSHNCNTQSINGFITYYNTISEQRFNEKTIKQYAQEFFDIHIQELKGHILNDISIAIENGQIDIQNEEERESFITHWTETHNSEIILLQQFNDKYKLGLTIKDRILNI